MFETEVTCPAAGSGVNGGGDGGTEVADWVDADGKMAAVGLEISFSI